MVNTEMVSAVRKKQRHLLTMKKYGFLFSIFAYPMALFIVFYIYVNINSIVMTFQTVNVDGSKNWVAFQNYSDFIKNVSNGGSLLGISVLNSVKLYFINLVISLPLYIIFSYILYKKFKGHNIMRAVVMIPQVVSGMVIALLFKKFISDALPEMMIQFFGYKEFPDLLASEEYAFGTIVFYGIWISFATSLIVYSNAMGAIDEEIMDSAHIDGVFTMWGELRYIILPLMYPTLCTFIVTGFAAFPTNDAHVMTFYERNAAKNLYTIGYYYNVAILKNETSGYNLLAAGGLIMSLILTPLTFLLKWALEKFGPSEDK